MSVIQIENLVKKYGANLAVDGLNLEIEGGKVYGFLGPNGAGKSTTMNVITGYIGATSGTVKVNGFDILKDSKKAKASVGYLPEQPPLYNEMTVKEYLKFVAELKGIPKKDREDAINAAVEKTGIKEVFERLIRNLSKGYKQRVGIAQAIIGMPEIIILDEPTVGLDPKQIVEIRDLIKSLGEDHTVILSSHLLPEVSEVCDYIYVISQGKLVAEGTESELSKDIAKENILEVTIQGDKAVVETLVDDMVSVKDFSVKETAEGVVLTVRTEEDTDIRSGLFAICASKGLPIVGMNYQQSSLEDVFLEITEDYKAPEKKTKKKDKDDIDAVVVTEVEETVEETDDFDEEVSEDESDL
ncbi:MAG: ABC transporter ATP-binding protein [Eubacterium sp.]|nr:ABC transporter ATP-binding protein [Eubacterium sp.]